MARPKADLGALVVPKAAAAQAVPHAGTAGAGTSAKALTVKLDPDTYWRLQRYCMERGQAEGRRVTHQEVMAEALRRLLATSGAG